VDTVGRTEVAAEYKAKGVHCLWPGRLEHLKSIPDRQRHASQQRRSYQKSGGRLAVP